MRQEGGSVEGGREGGRGGGREGEKGWMDRFSYRIWDKSIIVHN